jgi:leukotriene-A4 hydrolase
MTLPTFLRTATCVIACLWAGAALAIDPASYANPAQVRVRGLHLDLKAEFAQRSLSGFAELTLNWIDPEARTVALDTRELAIARVQFLDVQQRWVSVPYQLDKPDPVMGQALRITLPLQAARLRIDYRTAPTASALQWLAPAQTLSGKWPMLYNQPAPGTARSWVPLQDTPAVRFTYTARIDAPAGLRVLMKGDGEAGASGAGGWRFTMPQPIPSGMLAIAIGELASRAVGPRTTVYAEPLRIAAAAFELDDTRKMIVAAESLYGPYRWQRFDMLVLPASFPDGGGDSPRLAFFSAAILAGDRSLAGAVATALARSWAGSLPGHAAYVANRIIESVYGAEAASMQRQLDQEEVAAGGARAGWLLHTLEQRIGRARFDPFLRAWFDQRPFSSATPAQFADHLRDRLLAEHPQALSAAELDAWLTGGAAPASAAREASPRLAKVDAERTAWLAGTVATGRLADNSWSALEWMKFLNDIDGQASAAQLAELDSSFGLSLTSNHEIAFRFHRAAIKAGYMEARPALASFLAGVGRVEWVEPLYAALLAQPQEKGWARTLYASRARPQYHPQAQAAIDALMRRVP